MKLFITYNQESDKSSKIYQSVIDHDTFQKKSIFELSKVQECDIIICIGGDGFLLTTINKYNQLKKPIYPINGGTVGFLTNSFNIDNMFDNIIYADKIALISLQVKINNKLENAYNEISLLRKSPQAIHLELYINDEFTTTIIGDGLIISTPLGSSGYNYSSGGSILPLTSNLLSITPICPYKPKNWKGAIIENDVTIKIKILDSNKRPAIINLDNREFGNIKDITIKCDSDNKSELLLDNYDKFKLKILKEQFS